MLSRAVIQKLAEKNQTLETNIAREYCQHLILDHLYQQKKCDRLLFKGGTCLRILYNSPRFSEDLDFTSLGLSFQDLKTVFRFVSRRITEIGLKVSTVEEKVTSGGYIGIYQFEYLDFMERIKVECSFRKTLRAPGGELFTVAGKYMPPFTVLSLPTEALVAEKLSALLERGKPRDYYDIYFILRSNILGSKIALDLGKVSQRLVESTIDFKRELRPLLPMTHHNILKDFKGILLRELRRSGF